ncbi:hypothetical protein GCM10022205_15410 [Spinactinospora alkalitolerans]
MGGPNRTGDTPDAAAPAPPPELSLPELDPFDRLDERVADADGLTSAERAQSAGLSDELRGAYEEVRPALRRRARPWACRGAATATINGGDRLAPRDRLTLGP